MEYEQVVQPDLGVEGKEGQCLVYVREIFKVATKYPSALADWDASTALNHANEQPPANVSVPIFFSYVGPEDQDGHVAVWDQGTIYSTSAKGDKTFSSVQELIEWMDESFAYLGWSEEIDGVAVVKALPAAPTSGLTVQINPGTWNVRTGAGLASPIINIARGGQEYGNAKIMTNGWAEIEFTDKVGYVSPAGFKVV